MRHIANARQQHLLSSLYRPIRSHFVPNPNQAPTSRLHTPPYLCDNHISRSVTIIMSVEDDPMQSLVALSIDTSANINEDITWASEYLEGSPKRALESVFSNFRGSIDGGSTIMNAFNILKQGVADEDERSSTAFSPLGPNSIFELTVASDAARVRQNRRLKHQVTLNGGATTVYNLTKPTNKDIPQIQLHSLKNKVSNAQLTADLVTNVLSDYKGFELSYKALTKEVLQQFSEHQENAGSLDSDVANGSDEEMRDIIPSVYEDPEFRLDDPRIFREVMENSKVLPDLELSDSTHIVHNTEVQEKISKYLDTVEIELIQEISKTSDSFFSTLGDIQTIKSQSADCLTQFHGIMAKMDELEEGQAKIGLNILDLLDERRSVNHLESSVLQIKSVMSSFDKANELFNEGKNSDCLNWIVVIENLLQGVDREDYSDPDSFALYPKFHYPLVPLKNLPALKRVMRDLQRLKQACSQGYIKNFVDLLLENLRYHYKSVSATDTMNRIYISIDRTRKYSSNPVSRLYTEIDLIVKENLREFINNLSKSGQLVQAFDEYQDKIIAEVKAIIRNGLPNNSAESAMEANSNHSSRASSYPPGTTPLEATPVVGSNGGTLSSNIKSLSAKEFNEMMKDIYAKLSECLRRLTIHQKLLLDLSLSSLSPDVSQNMDVMALDITNSINKAIEITQVRLVKVLNVRLEQLGDASVEDYLYLYLLSSAYLLECEFINPVFVATGPGSSLTEWVKNHVAYFLHRFHSNSIKRFASLCDKETWKECISNEVVASAQLVVDELIAYSYYFETGGREGIDGSKWMSLLDFYDNGDPKDSSRIAPSLPEPTGLPRLEVNGLGYLIPPLVIKVIENTRDYIIISKIFASRATQIESNLLTFFNVVNSRISQAILNAGATRTAGLRHITTKHLALCIQTIEFFTAFLESIQFTYKNLSVEISQINPGSDEQSFTGIISHYKDHEKELFSKLVSIMHDRTLNHCIAVTKLDLSQPLKHPQQCHPYMETLVKETITVAKVLGKYLQDKECSTILLQIFDNYKKLLVNCFCTELPQFKDFNEKHSLLKDIDYFRVKLSEIPGYGNSGQVIWENVNSLPTIEDARMDQIMRNNIEGERAAAAAAATAAAEKERHAVNKSPTPTVDAPTVAETKEETEIVFEQEGKPEIEAQKEEEKEEENEEEKEEKKDEKKEAEKEAEKEADANAEEDSQIESQMEPDMDTSPEISKEPTTQKSTSIQTEVIDSSGATNDIFKHEERTSESPVLEEVPESTTSIDADESKSSEKEGGTEIKADDNVNDLNENESKKVDGA